ncbi:type II toxin-antitoxin system RelE/ParE family toxin [Chryseobacterium foetidum]|uniref:type II toxin-antitoxin system RelE/ParE family toxin n=1 Tax=Chryseobacterium foetidum TaxID=2951057 RepID=UPI0021C93140|nr:type II toxin-antitoxin system RelE/ParE family toxin [Chryseobacterium foetidum]
MTKVVWSDLAKRNLRKTVDYLFENWSLREVKNFKSKISILTDNISGYTSIFPKSKILNLRKCFVDKNNALIYLFENNIIYIVTIVNSRSLNQY